MDLVPSHIDFHLIITCRPNDNAKLLAVVRAVRRQLYHNWRLSILLDGPPAKSLVSVIRHESRIQVVPGAGDRFAVENDVAPTSVHGFVGFLDSSVVLEPDALSWAALTIHQHPSTCWIYFDHVQVDSSTVDRLICKPAFSPEYLLSCMFTGPFNIFATEAIRRAGGIAGSPRHAAVYDLALRVSELYPATEIRHIPQFTYTAGPDSDQAAAERDEVFAIERAFRRRGVPATIHQVARDPRVYHPRFVTSPTSSIAVIIPTRNQTARLTRCIADARAATQYADYHIVVIDNQSDDPGLLRYLNEGCARGEFGVEKFDEPFNYARMHNRVIGDLDCDYVILLNNDVYGFSANWIEQMVGIANLSSDIGCEGCLLRYPNGDTQHGGVTFGIGRPCRHAHLGIAASAPGYCGRLQAIQELSASTAALLLVRRSAFLHVGGFDEQRFPVSFNDTDLCMKFRHHGYRVIYNPSVTAVHEEGISRGVSPLEDSWRRVFQAKWGETIDDPFYNPHLSRHGFTCEDNETQFWKEKKRLALATALKAA
jgi:GT2 family glycosyltransferase